MKGWAVVWTSTAAGCCSDTGSEIILHKYICYHPHNITRARFDQTGMRPASSPSTSNTTRHLTMRLLLLSMLEILFINRQGYGSNWKHRNGTLTSLFLFLLLLLRKIPIDFNNIQNTHIFQVRYGFVIPIDKVVVMLGFLFEIVNSNCQANWRNC